VPVPLHEIEKEAQRVVRSMHALEPPIKIDAIIAKSWPKIFIGPADLGDFHGALVTDNGRAAMYVTDKANEDQKNIILAHLTWHWLKHALKGNIDVTRQCMVHAPRPEDPAAAAEREADVFASELLVPLEVLERFLDFAADPTTEEQRAFISKRTGELAKQFAVPYEVMKQRLTLFSARRRSFKPTFKR